MPPFAHHSAAPKRPTNGDDEMPQELIANARMYAVAPGAAAAWKALFAWLIDTTGVPLTVIDHAFPAKLDDLWRREDLACTFMCGWPWLRLGLGHKVIAAPIPKASYAQGNAVYCSHFIVRRDSPFETLESTFGHRFAFTIDDSHSGYNAPRHHLLRYRRDNAPLYREIVGPLTTPRRVLEAIAEGRADVGPQDSFAFDLMQRHAPELTSTVRIVASTETMPMPALMASAHADVAMVETLADALCALHSRPECDALRDDLCIDGFVHIDPAAYHLSERWAKAAELKGMKRIA
jgi:ABC-type phosphate/phosphonate transport system substrate-binding protein